MKLDVDLYGNNYKIKPYKIKHIKKAIFTLAQKPRSMRENIDILFEVLVNKNNKELPELDYYEKLYILLILKSKIDDNDITLTYVCSSCGMTTESVINISNTASLYNTDISIDLEDKIIKIKYADSIEESVGEDILDSLSIDAYKVVDIIYNGMQSKFKFSSEVPCILCSSSNTVTLGIEELINIILPFNAVELYNRVNFLIINGFTHDDIMSMLPHEMDIFINLNTKNT